jgi:hypothetical protein
MLFIGIADRVVDTIVIVQLPIVLVMPQPKRLARVMNNSRRVLSISEVESLLIW